MTLSALNIDEPMRQRALGSPLLSLSDAVGAAVVVTDLTGRILVWSDGAQRLLGWHAGDVLGRSALDMTDWGLSADDITATLTATDKPWVTQVDVTAADGSLVTVSVAVMRLVDDGCVVAVGMPAESATCRPDDLTPEQRRLERRFRALGERAADLILICDRDIVIRYAGPSLESMFGYSAQNVVGMSGWAFVHPDDEPRARVHWAAAVDSPGVHPPLELRVRHADGTWRWVEERITNLLDAPDVGGIVVNISDVSDRHAAQAALAEREQFFRSMVVAAQEGIWAVDLEGRTRYANAKMAELLGVDREELLAGSMWDFYDSAAQGFLRDRMGSRPTGSRDSYELPFVRRDGERRWLLVSAAPLTDATGAHTGSVGMCADITERKQNEEQLRRLALYDGLTGLPNRSLLTDRLQQLQERHRRTGEPVAVLFCDLDRFKLVNDNRGHGIGDSLLTAVGARLRGVLGAEDTLARFGGDEFVILLPDVDTAGANQVAAEVCGAFRAPFDVAGHPVVVGVSVGVASTEGVPAEELLQAADRALYRAKAAGRGRVEVHTAAMRRATEGRLALVADLRQALDNDELSLHYQPVVRLDGRPCGVEALLRWTHEGHGPVSPERVVAIADENGLTADLDAWVLNRACADMARLRSASGLDVRVAVNLSPQHLCDPALTHLVREALHRSGLPPRALTLEVTETAVVADLALTRPVVDELKRIGVRLVLDDFGTGYSSLAYLRQFPVDAIKVDRSFVAGMITNSDDLAIVASVVNLAATVGVDLIAEGVETEEQAEALRRLGCSYAQGHLWSPAVPLAELPEVLSRDASGTRPRRPAPAGRAAAPTDDCQPRILALHRNGASPASIAAALNAEGLKAPHGARWHRNSVAKVIAAHAYPDLHTILGETA